MRAESHTSLPFQPNPVIGRDKELELIRRLVVEEGTRVVTLTGPAGTGKTRLALAAGEQLAGEAPDGVMLVDLSAFGDWRLVLPCIARSLGLRKPGGRVILHDVVEALQTKRSLIILDNFEHLLGAAGQVADLLSACADLRILVTSREPLRIAWEHVLPVSPLRLADPSESSTLDGIAAAAAVALFSQRAAAVQPEFTLNSENCRAVAEICARLDGLPLAIELAAARVNVLPPQAMVGRLDRRLELLKGGGSDRPSRHRALRAAIDWSCALLEPPEQELFAALGVFASGCTLEAASAIAPNGETEEQILDLMSALCNKSLLQRDGRSGEEPRFRMLETVREYALERLTASGKVDEAAHRSCHYYVELAQRAASEIGGTDRQAWIERMEQEHDNLRVSLRWLAAHGQVEAALCLGAYLAPFWSLWGHLDEGQMWLSSLLELPEAAAPAAAREAALGALSSLARAQAEERRTQRAAAGASADPNGITARELDVLRLIARGMTNKEIARELVLSIPTVQTHLANIFRKIDVHSRAAAAAYVLMHHPGAAAG